MNPKKFRSAYADKDQEQLDTDVSFMEPSMTLQSCKDECDIHQILERHARTGQLDHANNAIAQYGDYSEVQSYQEALETVRNAHELFEALPSKVREKFSNNPGEFLSFAENPDNQREMAELGLATLRPQTPDLPTSAAVKNDPPKADQSAEAPKSAK